jgi:hypothetical protein
MFPVNTAAPAVSLNLGSSYIRQDNRTPSNVNGAEPPKGESIVYKIPPAFWILFFLAVGYLGMRYIMED